MLTNRICAIAITADMSFRIALAADFNREYKILEFLWKQKPGIGGVAALTPAASQILGKKFMLLGDEGDGEAARGPGKLGLVLDATERLPCGDGGKGSLPYSIRPEPRTIA